MKISARIKGRVTSLQVRSSVAALYCLITNDTDKDPHSYMLDTVHKILDKWEGDTARGLSSFITDELIKKLIDKGDRKEYKQIYEILQ